MAQIILDSNNNLIQGDFDNATLNNRTKLQTTTTNATTNVYVVPNGSSTSAGVSVANNSSLTNASKIVMATNGSTDTQIISGVNGSGSYLPLSFYTNNALAMQIGTNGQVTVAATANPTFSAYQSSAQTIPANTYTKITFDTEEWDTNSNFASSRFTPTVAGYYQINARYGWTPYTTGYNFISIFKNGSLYQRGNAISPNGNYAGVTATGVVYCNGTTDYIEIYSNSTAIFTTEAGQGLVFFSGFLARSA
jgi:hypothetical protein